MSLLKSKPYWNGILVAVFFAMTASVMAFTPEGMRLWKPYQPEQFGGSRRSTDGVYGSIEAIYWQLGGGPRDVSTGELGDFFGGGLAPDEVNTNISFGTRVSFGNRMGHHGWKFRGYGIKISGGTNSNGNRAESDNISNYWQRDYTYNAAGDVSNVVVSIPSAASDPDYWTGKTSSVEGFTAQEMADYLVRNNVYSFSDQIEGSSSASSVAKVQDIELMYTYRTHPFTWGEMGFNAGVRYVNFRHALTLNRRQTHSFSMSVHPLDDTADYFDIDSDREEVTLPDFTADNYVVKSVSNHIVGPQFGASLERRKNRWTFGAEGYFILGINNQSYMYSQGYSTDTNSLMAARRAMLEDNNDDNSTTTNDTDDATSTAYYPFAYEMMRIPQGNSQKRFRRTVFSPGVELNFDATWHWTDAVGIKFGFDSTVIRRVARGNDLTVTKVLDGDGVPITGQYDYSFTSKGGVSVLYGVNVGLVIAR